MSASSSPILVLSVVVENITPPKQATFVLWNHRLMGDSWLRLAFGSLIEMVTTGPTIMDCMASKGIKPALNADALSVIPLSVMMSAGCFGLMMARNVHRKPAPKNKRSAVSHTIRKISPAIPDLSVMRSATGASPTNTKHPTHNTSILPRLK